MKRMEKLIMKRPKCKEIILDAIRRKTERVEVANSR